MSEWLPRVPLALVACVRAVLIPGEAGRVVSAEPLQWPRLGVTLRWRAPEAAPLRAPAR